jgi:hypothetical protein
MSDGDIESVVTISMGKYVPENTEINLAEIRRITAAKRRFPMSDFIVSFVFTRILLSFDVGSLSFLTNATRSG